MLEIIVKIGRLKMASFRKWKEPEFGPSLLAQALIGPIQPLHPQLRLKRYWFRLVTKTGTAQKMLSPTIRVIGDNIFSRVLTRFGQSASPPLCRIDSPSLHSPFTSSSLVQVPSPESSHGPNLDS